MISRLKDKLANDGTCLACWCGFRDQQLLGHIARQAFDVLVLDAQHGFHDEKSICDAIPAVLTAGGSPLVRIPVGRWDMVERVLDFGALGVIAPMINTGADAQRFANAAKFPQMGVRSYGPRYAAELYNISTNEYLEQANTSTLCLAQIETKEAYDNLDDILSVEGIDGVLMGPADFSISVTGSAIPDVYGEKTIELIADIARRTRDKGKLAACFTLEKAHAKQCLEMGYRLISVEMDGTLIIKGASGVEKNFDL